MGLVDGITVPDTPPAFRCSPLPPALALPPLPPELLFPELPIPPTATGPDDRALTGGVCRRKPKRPMILAEPGRDEGPVRSLP